MIEIESMRKQMPSVLLYVICLGAYICIYICVCMYIYTCICICIYVHVGLDLYSYMPVIKSLWVNMYVWQS